MAWPKGKSRKGNADEPTRTHSQDRLPEAPARAPDEVERPSYIGTNMRYVAPKRPVFQGSAVGYRPEPKSRLPILQPNRV